MQLSNLNWLDYAIVTIVLLSTLISLARGFVREALSLTSWILAIWIGLKFTHHLADYLQDYVSNSTVRLGLAFVSLFLATLILTGMLGYIIAHILDKTGLSGTDRILGTVFGLARGVLLVALLLLLVRMSPLPHEPLWMTSQMVPAFAPLEKWLVGFLPQDIDDSLQYTQPLPRQSQIERLS